MMAFKEFSIAKSQDKVNDDIILAVITFPLICILDLLAQARNGGFQFVVVFIELNIPTNSLG